MYVTCVICRTPLFVFTHLGGGVGMSVRFTDTTRRDVFFNKRKSLFKAFFIQCYVGSVAVLASPYLGSCIDVSVFCSNDYLIDVTRKRFRLKLPECHSRITLGTLLNILVSPVAHTSNEVTRTRCELYCYPHSQASSLTWRVSSRLPER